MGDTTPRILWSVKRALGSTRVLIAAMFLLLVASPSHAETYFYHTDHLGTPQVLTNTNQTVVWQAASEPFGEVTEAVTLVEQNLRFPGQYLDRESGLHYNYFRSYNSNTGRYTQSDPIGLGGGINTYGYAYQNPLKYTDPTGEIVPIIVWAWTAFEIASTAYDVYNAASTFADECSSTSDKLIAGSVLAAGVILPGRFSFVPNSGQQLAANSARGRASEARVLDDLGLEKNTQKVRGAEGNSIPDALTDSLSVEIKDAKNVSLTRQLRIQTEAARASGRQSILVTGQNTCVSGSCQRAFDQVIRRSDLGSSQ